MEIIGDFIGDDDGLCESNEDCIYAPNWGATTIHKATAPSRTEPYQEPPSMHTLLMAHKLKNKKNLP